MNNEKINIYKLNKKQLKAIVNERIDVPDKASKNDLLICCNMLGIRYVYQSKLNDLFGKMN